jgi:spoIIIJ-associated protein
VSEDGEIRVEALGETVGEAKWAALRELEALAGAVDREHVRFEVLAEGERGLLGIGRAPARVAASVSASQADQPPSDAIGPAATLAHDLVKKVATVIGARCTVRVTETGDDVLVVCSGPDVGRLIGHHGQTIDALQYLANAMARSQGLEAHVVIDAAGYRTRRASTLERLARRSASRATSTGMRVPLEPMTAVERKVVHDVLKDDPEVETESAGTEPNRFVVIVPRHADV